MTSHCVDDSGVAISRYRFSADFPGFQGHFPGNPILPAVVQVLLGAESSGQPHARIRSLSRAKFTRMVRPEEEIDVRCECSDTAEGLSASVQLSVDGEPASSFRLVLAEDGGNG